MKNTIVLAGLLAACIFYSSCGKHIYAVSYKELKKYAIEAREPSRPAFVIYHNGDSIPGRNLVIKHNKLNGKETWLMDGKEISRDNIVSYQDKDGFCVIYRGNNLLQGGNYLRIYRGRVNLYLRQTSDYQLNTAYNDRTKQFEARTSGGTHTTFYLGNGQRFEGVTVKGMNTFFADSPAALAAVKKEFPKEKAIMNDYRAILRILKIYDNKG